MSTGLVSGGDPTHLLGRRHRRIANKTQGNLSPRKREEARQRCPVALQEHLRACMGESLSLPEEENEKKCCDLKVCK